MKERVLFVVTTLGWGGAESQVIELALHFKRKGWDVAVATLDRRAERRDSLETQQIPVHTLGMVIGTLDPRAMWRLARVIRYFRPTVVHAHMVHSNLLARVTRMLSNIPVLISSAHSVNEGARWRDIAYRITDFLTDVTTNVSLAAVRSSVARGAVPEHRIRYMPNGVDLSRFRRDVNCRARTRAALDVEQRFVWLAVGRFQEAKDYPNLLDAFAQVVRHESAPMLLIVGEGPLRDQMEDYVRQLGIDGDVRFLGRREDVADLMNAADSYVMSSAWEGLPIVLLEAAASELPIVATKVGGNEQIVLQGQSGELVPARESDKLASAMRSLMDDSEEVRQKKGERGAAHIRNTFGIDSVVSQWEELYRELYSIRKNRWLASI